MVCLRVVVSVVAAWSCCWRCRRDFWAFDNSSRMGLLGGRVGVSDVDDEEGDEDDFWPAVSPASRGGVW